MKTLKTFLITLLISFTAFGQSQPLSTGGVGSASLTANQTFLGTNTFSASLVTGGLTSSVASGQNAIALTNGQRISLGSQILYSEASRLVTLGGLYVGSGTLQYGTLSCGYTDSSGTPGAATINNGSGKSAIAAGASSVVITNSQVTANDIPLIIPMSSSVVDCAGWYISNVTTGSFTITCPAGNTVGAWSFAWAVLTN